MVFRISWLAVRFGFNGPFRQNFSLHRAVSQREGEHRVASTPELVTKSTTETIIDRRHGTQWGKLQAFYGLLDGFSYHNKIDLCQRGIRLLPTSTSLKISR